MRINFDDLDGTQKDAFRRILKIHNDMLYAKLDELEKLYEEAKYLWWEYLPSHAEQFTQKFETPFFERRYNDFKRLRKEQASTIINIGTINIYNK